LRILMISDVYFPRVNGVSTSIRTFRRELSALGHEVTLIAPRYGADDVQDEPLTRVPSWRLPFDPEDRLMRRGAFRSLASPLTSVQFDLVHIQTPFLAHYEGVVLARRLGIPVVETWHTHFEEYFHHYVPFAPRWLLRPVARRLHRVQCDSVDALVAPSPLMRQVLEDYGVACPVYVIPTGLEEHSFIAGDGARFRASHGLDPSRPALVHVGRLAHEKNIDFLLRMLDELRRSVPEVLMIIAGEGPAATHLRRLTRRLQLDAHVYFTGYLDRTTELPDCYAAGDAFVFSSRTETQGMVLLEAMAQGTPVVALSVLGTTSILEAGKGSVTAADDTIAFARAVEGLLRDADLRQCLSREAREQARHWSARHFALQMEQFYRGVIAARGIYAN
jgi:glycosyltransferase involved in cell wall biosynthesis